MLSGNSPGRASGNVPGVQGLHRTTRTSYDGTSTVQHRPVARREDCNDWPLSRSRPCRTCAETSPLTEETRRRNTPTSWRGWNSSCRRAATTGSPSAIRATATPRTLACASLQVLDDNYEKATGEKIDPRQAHGSAYGMVAAARGYPHPIGTWNFEEVTVKDSKIKVELTAR